jgi:hypothetical protein
MKKAKRYQDGGKTEDQYKKEGLESSKDEKVGFFERLRMGNIDNPSSEAYRRFGAGRAKMAEEARTPVPEMSSDYSGRGTKSQSSSGSSEMMPRTKVSASDIGFTGGGEDVTNESSYMPRSTYKMEDIGDATNDDIKPKPKPKPKPRKRVSQSFGETDSDALNKRRLEGLKKEDSPYGKSERLKALMGTFSPERSSKRYAESTPYARSKMGMKSGGKVSSASSRADGIAQRGKTKGRIC